ncbi:Gldg family protein [uncultured Chitinophaga sp.]|uniref:Gldg family protein n=1 Tax=uncultured Chitinophaga sp. TaxID=339340 RepID=UPI0025F82507|nr:Gldg family protein [uncultured Chitinophaga sp.]
MKTIFKIAKTEIRQLFYSPIAWFLLIVFMVQCSLAYAQVIDDYARRQELGGAAMTSMKELTSWIFSVRYGIFRGIMQNLYLYIPLLTMGLISRETSSGTIKLLYSSPVTVTQIVLGKYVSMLIYSLCMLAVIVFLMIVGSFNIQSVDVGLMITSLFGFYLLLCTYAAIGLFMSSLTTYQVLAAISTFVMIGFLSYVGDMWQRYDFIRDLTYFLSLTGRTENLLAGLISSKDVLYFLLIIYIFLSLTILKMKGGRAPKPLAVRSGWYAAVIVSALLIGYVTSRPAITVYFDATRVKSQSLSPRVREIVEELGDDKLEVTAYANLLGGQYHLGLPQLRNKYLSLWEPYVRYKPDISFKYVSYWDSSYATGPFMMIQPPGQKPQTLREQAISMAKNFDYELSDYKTPEEMRKIIDLRPEHTRFVMQLKYKNRTTFLRVFDDMDVFPKEPEIAAAFKRLLDAKFPKIVFLTGNLERSPYKSGDREYQYLANYKVFRESFVNQGFDVDTVSLEHANIPDDATALVVADPRVALSAVTISKIRDYVNRGGNLVIAGEPGKADIVNPLLNMLGVQMMEGIIAQPDPQSTPDIVRSELAAASQALSGTTARGYRNKGIVLMMGAAGLTFSSDSGFTIAPALVTNPEFSWLKKGQMVTDSAAVEFDAAAGDERKVFPVALMLTRKINNREQRIFVAGDADFLSGRVGSQNMPPVMNFGYSTGIFSWLSDGQYPIEPNRPESKDRRLNISSDGVKPLRIMIAWVVPGLMTILAAIILIRRKRK